MNSEPPTASEVELAANLEFYCDDLNETLAVREWLKRILKQVLIEEESFSGKRPFGNSGWKYDVYATFIENEIVEGELDEWECVVDVDQKKADALLLAIVDNL